MNLSVIVPAYNEEKRVTKTLNSYLSFFPRHFNSIEIIVVCNGCKDRSAELVKKLSEKDKRISCLEYTNKIGKGGALVEGFRRATKEYVGFMDADDAFDLNSIKNMIYMLRDYDCVLASKWKNQRFSKVDEPFIRKVFGRGWNLLARLLFGLHFKDTQAGSKFFKKEVFEAINKNFLTKGFEFDVELLHNINKKGFSMKETYVKTAHIPESKFNFNHIPLMFFNIIRLRLRKNK